MPKFPTTVESLCGWSVAGWCIQMYPNEVTNSSRRASQEMWPQHHRDLTVRGDLLLPVFRQTGTKRCVLPRGGARWVGTESSGDQACCMLSGPCPPRQTRAWRDHAFYVRGSQCPNTLRGWDIKHPAENSSWPLHQHLRDRHQQRDWSHSRRFTIHTWSLPPGRNTTTTTIDEDMTQNMTRDTQH